VFHACDNSDSTNESKGATAVDYIVECLKGFAVGFVGGAVAFVLGGIAYVVMPFIFNNIGNPIARGLGRAVRLVYQPKPYDYQPPPDTTDPEQS
jgi:hypothetical protein